MLDYIMFYTVSAYTEEFFKNCVSSLCSIHFSFLQYSFVLVSYTTRVHGEVSNSPWASLQQILLVASIALSQFSAERLLEYRPRRQHSWNTFASVEIRKLTTHKSATS